MFFYSYFEKLKNSLVLSKLSNNKSDIIKILNFYEYNNTGGNTNIDQHI